MVRIKKSMANNGQQNSGAVMIAKSQVQNGGHWKFVPMGNGTYRIQNFYSKMYLANFQQKNSGAQLKQTDKPGPGALWRLKKLQGGYIQIVNDESKMAIGLGGQNDGAPLIQITQLTGQTTWLPVEITKEKPGTRKMIKPNVWYYLQNGQSKKSIATNGQTNSGAEMISKAKVGEGGQWQFVPYGNDLYRIQNKHSKMYLANFQQLNAGSKIKQTSKPAAGAVWRIEYLANGHVRFINNQSNLFITVDNMNEGSKISQSKSTNAFTTWAPIEVGK
jgi:hypothetical protein